MKNSGDAAANVRGVASDSFPFRLVLGSRSPRRRQLLTDAGYRFEILPADDAVEERENVDPSDPIRYVERLAFVKARDVAKQLKNGAKPEAGNAASEISASETASDRPTVVVACDSVAVCGGEILGKPRDRADAERMLRKLSGSVHSVETGLCLWTLPGDRVWSRVETSRLLMEPLSEERLAGYLESGLWEGKAGAFGYQDGNDWLRLIDGSESNVVGLPLEALAVALREVAASISER